MFAAMILYLLLVLIRPQDYPALVDSIGLPLLPLALILAALLWLFSGRKRFDAPQYLLLLLFFVAMLVSNIANGWFGGALEQINKFAPTVLAFVVLANAADSPARVRGIMRMFTLCAAVLALHGIEQAKLGVGWTGVELSQGTRIQYVGIFNDPNDLGLLFVMCLPMAVYLAMRGGWMGVAKLFWLLVAGVLLYGIYLTDSRGTLLATLVVMGAYVWWRRGLVVAGVLGACALAVLMALPSRMQELDASEASAAGRVDSWYEGLQMFQQNPLFGVGADMYSDHNPLTAHNSFVLVLAETGIVGFVLWLAFVGYCFRMMLTAVRQPPAMLLAGGGAGEDKAAEDDAEPEPEPDPDAVADWYDDRDLALTLLLSLCGFFTAAFFLSRSYLVVLYLLAALVVAHYTAMRQRNPDLPAFDLQHDLLRWPLYAAAGVAGLYVLVRVLLAMAL